jgi:hypothetical protein
MASSKTGKQGSGGAEDAAANGTETLYTLPGLIERLGKGSEGDLAAYIEGLTKADLVEEGAKIGTDRIDTDCARLYGMAADFFDRATDQQLDHLMGISPDMLRAAVWAAAQGSQLAQKRAKAAAGAGASKEERLAKAQETRAAALSHRRLLRAALLSLAAGNKTWLTAIEGATGTVENLADSLDGLVKVGRRMLKNPSPALKARLNKSRLTLARLTEIETLAEQVRSTSDDAYAVVSRGAVSQAEVDYWDGINLHLLGHFIDVFEAGHELDATIPRLLPISLRNYFRRPRRAAAPAGDGEKPVVGDAPKPV